MMNRRNFLRMAAASGAASALRYPFSAYGQSDEIRFGCPVPLSGPFAANGKFADMGMKFALDEKGKLLGRNLGYTAIDTEGKPATAIRKVQEEMQQKGAHFFVGGILSSEALAMGKEIDKAGGVFLTTAGADEITGSECNRATFRWSVPTYGAIEQTVRPLIGILPKAKRWYTITPQYVFGDGLLNAAKAVFKDKNIEHVGNSYHSLTEREFSGYLTNAMAAKPDVLLLLNFGSQSSDTLRQALSFRMKQNTEIVIAWASGLEQFESLGADLCEGIYFGAQYWHTIDTAFNRKFAEQVRSKLNMNPNYSFAGSYICTKMALDAIAKANSADPKAVIAALEGMKFDSLTGTEEVRKTDHQVLKDYYLLKGKAKSGMRDKDDYVEILGSGKSFLPIDKTMCKLA